MFYPFGLSTFSSGLSNLEKSHFIALYVGGSFEGVRLFRLKDFNDRFAAFIRAAIHARCVKAKGIITLIINRDNAAIALHIRQGCVDDVIGGIHNRLA